MKLLSSNPSNALATQKSDLIYGADFLSLLMAISSETKQEQSQNRPPTQRPVAYAQMFEYKNLESTIRKSEKQSETPDGTAKASHVVVHISPKHFDSSRDGTSRNESPLEVNKDEILQVKDTTQNKTKYNVTRSNNDNKKSDLQVNIEELDRSSYKEVMSADIETEDALRDLLMTYLQKSHIYVEPSVLLRVLGRRNFDGHIPEDQAQSTPIVNIGKQDIVDNSIDRSYVRNSRSTSLVESSSSDKLGENSENEQHRKVLKEREVDYEEYPARVRPLHNPHFAPTGTGYLDRDLDKKLQQTIIYHDNQSPTHTRSVSYSSVIQSLPQVDVDQENPGQHDRRERNYNTGQHFSNIYDSMEKKLNDTAKLYENQDLPQKDLLGGGSWTQQTKNDGDITTDATILSSQDNTWNKQHEQSSTFTTEKPWDGPKALPYILPTPLATPYGAHPPPNILFGHQKQDQYTKPTSPGDVYGKESLAEDAYNPNTPKTLSEIHFGQARQQDSYRGHDMPQGGQMPPSGGQYGPHLAQSTSDNAFGGQQTTLNAHGSSGDSHGHHNTNHNAKGSLYNTNIQDGTSTDPYGGSGMDQSGRVASQGSYEDGKPLQNQRSGERAQGEGYGHPQSQKRGQHDHTERYRNDKQLPTIYGRPEQNYEVEETISLVTNGRAHGVHQPTSTPKEEHYNAKKLDDNQKVGYVVEGRNYKKYRVEERTSDGFIVGEYGVVSHNDGSLRGVRYTADGTINPKVISEALMKFLSL
ncbi:unnamed protein product [Acanthoscelides obtectus]|uniref:Uncharacterized protein n=1 Tax=Acanthoscelides obtectus TaxID=200917 RepID=A0A9P0JN82_ACAOB|nr:unnamed protein product [Acanthoscelides obtectus]CAK1624932.1 hypothetical protein AOBTE_LOCUS2857 [Acanthoscelides obtectus]